MRQVLHNLKESRAVRQPNWAVKWLLHRSATLWSWTSLLRGFLYSNGVFKRYRLPVPVISVGNVAAGGTGKTPMVEYIAQLLSKRQIAILSRGYGGDEHVQTAANLPHISCFTAANRGRLGYELFKQEPFRFELVLLDDALQHPSIHKDVEIVMVNAVQGMDGQYARVIPAGLLRETWEAALQRAHLVVVHHADKVLEKHLKELTSKVRARVSGSCNIVYSRMRPVALVPFEAMRPGSGFDPTKEGLQLAQDFDFDNVHVFCGIGCGDVFVRSVRDVLGEGRAYTFQTFADHHAYSSADILEIMEMSDRQRCAIITTEKDFYRNPNLLLSCFQDRNAFCLRSSLEIFPGPST